MPLTPRVVNTRSATKSERIHSVINKTEAKAKTTNTKIADADIVTDNLSTACSDRSSHLNYTAPCSKKSRFPLTLMHY
jgi:hypothetical protein